MMNEEVFIEGLKVPYETPTVNESTVEPEGVIADSQKKGQVNEEWQNPGGEFEANPDAPW
jgi:hypothetical protein